MEKLRLEPVVEKFFTHGGEKKARTKYKVFLFSMQIATIKEYQEYSYETKEYELCWTVERNRQFERNGGTYIGSFKTVVEAKYAIARSLEEKTEYWDLTDSETTKRSVNAKLLPASEENEFYPTPEKLAGIMLSGVNWNEVYTVLEPSAGKADLIECAEKALEKNNKRYKQNSIDVDCIECDVNLQHIIRGKGYKLVHDDFLTYNTPKKYDLILMNPPFSNADKHLLKALDIQKNNGGGAIICLLNAETLRNPCTNTRLLLLRELKRHSAKISYIKKSFVNAERKTDVDVAVVKVYIEEEQMESDIYNNIKKAQKIKDEDNYVNDIVVNDLFEQYISQFNVEVEAGISLIKQYNALTPYILVGFKNGSDSDKYLSPSLNLEVSGKNSVSINDYLKVVRRKYWRELLSNSKVIGKLTKALRTKYYNMVDELENYDFTIFNIKRIVAEINNEIVAGVKKVILDVFDLMSAKHSHYPECQNNIHYFDGWCTNSAHKVGKKVILPIWGAFDNYSWHSEVLRISQIYDALGDIEKVFNYLKGNVNSEDTLYHCLENTNQHGQTKNIACKYFTATFYKKGTVHLTFTDLAVVEMLNIYAARNREWLPPCYGRKTYENMTVEEKAVIDDFQGEMQYGEVIENPEKYLFEISQNSSMLLTA